MLFGTRRGRSTERDVGFFICTLLTAGMDMDLGMDVSWWILLFSLSFLAVYMSPPVTGITAMVASHLF